jgi:hypothetical protein
MTDNSIGKWNPAWGAKPIKVKERAPKRKNNRWYRVTCWTCPETPRFSVYGKESLEEQFHCVGCGLPMAVSTVATEAEAARLPTERRHRRPSSDAR